MAFKLLKLLVGGWKSNKKAGEWGNYGFCALKRATERVEKQ